MCPLNWESKNTKIKREKTDSPQLSESLEQAKLGQVREWVWSLEIWSENGCGKWYFLVCNKVRIRRTGHHPPPRIPSTTLIRGSGAGCKSCHHNHRLEYNVGWLISVIYSRMWVIPPPLPSPLNTAFVHRGMPYIDLLVCVLHSVLIRNCGKNFTDLTNTNTIFLIRCFLLV